MSFLIGFLTFILIVDCLLLILLVLIQLPKKDAGAGLAFGGTATDALFGAGTGNVLTKITKYATAAFFVLAMALAIMQSKYYHRPGSELQRLIEQQSKQPAAVTLPSSQSAATPGAPAVLTNLELVPQPAATNSTAPAPVNPAPASAPQK